MDSGVGAGGGDNYSDSKRGLFKLCSYLYDN